MHIRKATTADIRKVHDLVHHYAARGRMLRRPLLSLYEEVRDFAVAVDEDGAVIGTGALHVLWHDLGEIRATAVAPSHKGRGVGRDVVDFLVREAESLGLARVFIFTYEPQFFARCGFQHIDKSRLPQKVWKECIYCDKFEACDEIPMIRYLQPAAQDAAAEHGLNDFVELQLPS